MYQSKQKANKKGPGKQIKTAIPIFNNLTQQTYSLQKLTKTANNTNEQITQLSPKEINKVRVPLQFVPSICFQFKIRNKTDRTL